MLLNKSWMVIREIKENDAEYFLLLRKRMEKESPFMLQGPDERDTTIREQAGEIKDILSNNNGTIFIAENDGELIGFIKAFRGRYIKNRHSVWGRIFTCESFCSEASKSITDKQVVEKVLLDTRLRGYDIIIDNNEFFNSLFIRDK